MPDPSVKLKAKRDAVAGAAPLVFDLDGTLIATDLLLECVLQYLRRRPLGIFQLVAWLLRGRAHLKRRVAEAVELDVDLLPVRAEVVAYAVAAAATREVYIATAADEVLASRLLSRFDFATAVIGSQGSTNLAARHKAQALSARFPGGFAYVGDSHADLPVWRAAGGAVYAGRSIGLRRKLFRMKTPEMVLAPTRPGIAVWARALRLHQWAKNSLIFVPIILGGQTLSIAAWTSCLLAFLGLSLLASATYVINDLLDLQEDRRHQTKRHRPFASGTLSIKAGMAVVPVGLGLGLAVGMAAGGLPAVALMGLYLAVTLAYSFRLKRVAILDVVVLAGLFTLRIAVGVVCAAVAWSAWLLVFSMFIFTGLSLAKRLTELRRVKVEGGDRLPGRGYVVADEPLVMALGVSLASATVMVMVMYLIEEAFVAGYYGAPALLWTFPVILALWLGRIWLLCGRGELDDDPVVFALRDRVSLGLGAVMAISLAAAVVL